LRLGSWEDERVRRWEGLNKMAHGRRRTAHGDKGERLKVEMIMIVPVKQKTKRFNGMN